MQPYFCVSGLGGIRCASQPSLISLYFSVGVTHCDALAYMR
jgi:hypothetical protein